MPALHALPAVGALPDVHAELANQRPARDLRLELLGHSALHQPAVAVRAGAGEPAEEFSPEAVQAYSDSLPPRRFRLLP